jgi:hypothetical protein
MFLDSSLATSNACKSSPMEGILHVGLTISKLKVYTLFNKTQKTHEMIILLERISSINT